MESIFLYKTPENMLSLESPDIKCFYYISKLSNYMIDLEKSIEKIKSFKNDIIINIEYANENIKERIYGVQEKYIVEFKILKKFSEFYGHQYKLENVYEMPSIIQLKLKLFKIEKIHTEKLEIIKDSCIRII